MDVILGIRRKVVVEDNVDLIDIKSARGDIGGDEEFDRAVTETLEHTLAHLLGDIPVQAVGGVTAVDEILGALIDGTLGVAENDPEAGRVHVENAGKHLHLGALAHLVVCLLDGGYGHRLLLDLNDFRLVSEFLDETGDSGVHRRGEKQDLAFLWQGGEDFVHLLLEAHVEHAVGLVENRHANAAGIEGAAAQVIQKAPGRADHDLCSVAERAELPVDRRTAVNRSRLESLFLRPEAVNLSTNLHSEFTCRAKYQHLRKALGDVNIGERWQRKGRRFPRTGGGEA